MGKEFLEIKGVGEIRELDPVTSEVLNEQRVTNVVVNEGLSFLASAIDDGVSDRWTHIAIGSSGTGEDVSDDGLISFEEALPASSEIIADNAGQNTVVKFGPVTFPAGAGKSSIEEAAIQDGSTGADDIFNRLTFASADNETRDLEVTIYIDVGNTGF